MTSLNKKILTFLGTAILAGAADAGTRSADYSKTPMQPAPEVCGPWFSGITGGVWWVQDFSESIPFFPTNANVEFGFDTGFGINVTPIGYRFSDMFSVSLETGYFQADTNSATSAGISMPATGGQLRLAPTLLNANLTFPVAEHIKLYLTGGVGGSYRELEAEVPVFPGVTFHDSGWNIIAQAKAGVAFEVGRCSYINVGYRYQHVFANPDDIQGHSVEVGYTFTW